MTRDEFTEKIKSDDKYLRLIVRSLYRLKSLDAVATMHSVPEDVFDIIFVDDPEFEEKFARVVQEEFSKIQKVVAWPRLDDALKTLSNITASMDESRAIAAASALVRAQQMLTDIINKQEVEEDDIDKIWKEMEDERQK